jgi:ribonuclease D
MCQEIYDEEQVPPWERISGAHRLSRRELAVLQRLAVWRERTAAELNKPVRRILRDDLLLDLAKRRPVNVQQALATRDLNRPEYRKRLPDMVDVIAEALRLPEDRLPPRLKPHDDAASDDQIISRLLALALANVCAELEIAQLLVGTGRDLTELVRAVRGGENGSPPLLLQGWRNEICGELLRKVLDGRMCFRVAPKNSATPLIFEETPDRRGR